MPQKVAFFNETPGDTFVSYVLDGTTTTTTVGVAVSSLPITPTPTVPYFQEDDDNSVKDACAVIPSVNTATATFQRSNLSTYTATSNPFIGPRPPVRPH